MRKLIPLLLLLSGLVQAGVTIVISQGLIAVPAPTFSPPPNPPPAAAYGVAQQVTVSETQTPSTIYCAIGQTPSTSGAAYSGPITVATSQTLECIATATGFLASVVGTADYVINISPTGTPQFSPDPATSTTIPVVTVSDITPSSTLYCTQDGTPASIASPSYAAPATFTFSSPGSYTLRCKALGGGLTLSAEKTGVYVYQPPATTPTINPVAGTYVSQVVVSITETPACAGSIIYYTNDSTTPTTSSLVYSGAFTVTTNTVITVMATCPLYAQSQVTVPYSYVITQPQQAATPTFSLAPGSYVGTQTVNILDASPAPAIMYTIDGTPPTLSHGTSCTPPACAISVGVTETIKAIASSTGFTTSAVGKAAYTISAATNLPCPQTTGTLTVNVTTNRNHGASPLMIWNDASATTDSSLAANITVAQGVTFTWEFGDGGASGSGVWLYGSNANKNSTDGANGIVGGHLYRITDGTGDKTFRAAVTAQDAAGNVVTCLAPVITVNDPAGSNAYDGINTTCVAATTTPVAGSGGCPAGARPLKSSSYVTALNATFMGNAKRVLFKCGDTFTGTDTTVNAIDWSIGAYGGCEGTQAARPIFDSSTTSQGALMVAYTAGNGRIADIDCEGAGTGGGCVNTPASSIRIPYQVTLSNLLSNGNKASFAYSQGAQWALVGVNQASATGIGTFMNYNENNPAPWSGNAFNNLDYQALLGSFINGVGTGGGAGVETVRISACRLCVIENNTIQNANSTGAVLKLHNGNTSGSVVTWSGVWTENVEISDNLFTGNSGGQLVEVAPQNGGLDERLRNIVLERNLFSSSTQSQGGLHLLVSGQNVTARDNIFSMIGQDATHYPILGAQFAQRGAGNIIAQFNEAYNNTCRVSGTIVAPQYCVGFDVIGSKASPTTSSFAKNNLFYINQAGQTTVDDTGGNTVSNNTTTPNSNPVFSNSSASFSLISDFIPSANYTGGASVDVTFDALGTAWSPTWDLGAVSHTDTSPAVNYWTQPALDLGVGINKFYGAGANGKQPPDGNWYMNSDEPVQCANGTSNLGGGFATAVDLSPLTGFSTTSQISYKNAPACNTAVHASAAQASGSTVGAYINGSDLASFPGFGPTHIKKFGIFGEIWFDTSLPVQPFLSYNTIEVGFYQQVYSATDASPPLQTGNTSNTYSSSDVSFVDPNGNKIVFSVSAFFNGSIAATKCERPVADGGGSLSWELKCQLQPNIGGLYSGPYITMLTSTTDCTTPLATDSSCTQFAPWQSGYKYFHYQITQAQMARGLLEIKTKAVSPPPYVCPDTNPAHKCFSLDPNVWTLQHYHINAELHYATKTDTQMGWSSNGNFINFY